MYCVWPEFNLISTLLTTTYQTLNLCEITFWWIKSVKRLHTKLKQTPKYRYHPSCPWHWLCWTVKVCKSSVLVCLCVCALSLSLSLSSPVFLVTDGLCKQLCVTGLVAWFLLEWLCNSNPTAPLLSPHLPLLSELFYITSYVEHCLFSPLRTHTVHAHTELQYWSVTWIPIVFVNTGTQQITFLYLIELVWFAFHSCSEFRSKGKSPICVDSPLIWNTTHCQSSLCLCIFP